MSLDAPACSLIKIPPLSAERPLLFVAAALLIDAQNRVLLAQRPADKSMAGLWEFPGGKVEAGETVSAALARELHEELGIHVQTAAPWLQVRHAYADRQVLLDVWQVDAYQGEPQGREGQPLAWVAVTGLREVDFPAADAPIIAALRTAAALPAQMVQQASSKATSAVL